MLQALARGVFYYTTDYCLLALAQLPQRSEAGAENVRGTLYFRMLDMHELRARELLSRSVRLKRRAIDRISGELEVQRSEV